MKNISVHKNRIFVGIYLISANIIFPQIVLKNPGIPMFESISYRQEINGNVESLDVEVENIEENNYKWIEYRLFSNEQDILIKFNSDNLTAFYSEIWDKKSDSTVHTINEIVKNNKVVKGKELLITDMYGFLLSIRGFPWGEKKSAQIVFLNGSSDFKLDLKVKGKETVQIDDKFYECWKVQMGIGGIMGAIFPKSNYWYGVESPHILIRSESTRTPGSPKTILEINSYKSNL